MELAAPAVADCRLIELLCCPACQGALEPDFRCHACATSFAADDGIPDLRAPGDVRTERVRAFYSAAPFPGYPPNATPAWLRSRAGRSPFARLLDEAIAPDARVVEIGC
ncbi:MAG: 2-polyprenyl-3-methyl-5-hydroxy-6-metoxy-1,4-benzoquinol methylase, partial [Novosphingobium sp.]|nr:2-polyprenyl-3-methyl-5-hydroxy-6-metoxy-1,4-benzoquinol methylase [Novosphingobium sp.]